MDDQHADQERDRDDNRRHAHRERLPDSGFPVNREIATCAALALSVRVHERACRKSAHASKKSIITQQGVECDALLLSSCVRWPGQALTW